MCSWRVEINESSVIRYVGRVPDDKLDVILQIVDEYQLKDDEKSKKSKDSPDDQDTSQAS
jgi:hypothetical protein